MKLIVLPSVAKYFSSAHLFDQLMKLQGEVFRKVEKRTTQRVKIGENHYFIKQHFGVGWREIIKNILQWRLPIISASNEYNALTALHDIINVPEIIAFGSRGINPASRQSFLLTAEIPDAVSLEDLTKTWRSQPARFTTKQYLIKEVARITERMHRSGINHRDLYICHFVFTPNDQLPKLFLIDLHRAQMRKKVPLRWKIKDLAALYFSSKEIGLTSRDLLRFIRNYTQQPLKKLNLKLWKKVAQRGERLYRKHGN